MGCSHPRQVEHGRGLLALLTCAWPTCTDGVEKNVLKLVTAGKEVTWRRVRVHNDWFWVRATDDGGVWNTTRTGVDIDVP